MSSSSRSGRSGRTPRSRSRGRKRSGSGKGGGGNAAGEERGQAEQGRGDGTPGAQGAESSVAVLRSVNASLLAVNKLIDKITTDLETLSNNFAQLAEQNDRWSAVITGKQAGAAGAAKSKAKATHKTSHS